MLLQFNQDSNYLQKQDSNYLQKDKIYLLSSSHFLFYCILSYNFFPATTPSPVAVVDRSPAGPKKAPVAPKD